VIRKKDYKHYLNWQSQEEMDSTSQASIVENSLNHLPEDAKTILCVGIGDGYEMLKIRETKRAVSGITLNKQAVKYDGLDVYKMDMHHMAFESASFDLVYAKDVFEHAFSHWLALKEMVRVSKKYIMIILPDTEKWSGGKYHTIVPNEIQMIELAKKFGLKLVDQWKFGAKGHHPVYGYLFVK